MPFPRYTTYRDDELVAAIKQLTPTGQTVPDASTLRRQGSGHASTRQTNGDSSPTVPSRGPLLKEHHCAVAYPDGATGACRYVRIGPDWHLFQYRHHGTDATPDIEVSAADRFLTGTALPVQRFSERMGNTAEAIEAKARELADAAFAEAIRREQKERFQRASARPAWTGKKQAAGRPQFSAKRAKEIGGKYALCRPLGGANLVPDSPLFGTLAEANAAWRERGDASLQVACACRWSRRWELPRFNPLYAEQR